MESRTAHMKYLEIGAQPGFPNTQSSASRLCWQESLVLVMNDQTSKSAGTLAIEETFTNDEPLDKTLYLFSEKRTIQIDTIPASIIPCFYLILL